jgi:hypothetical protein
MQYCSQIIQTVYVRSLQTELTSEMLRMQILRMLSIIFNVHGTVHRDIFL